MKTAKNILAFRIDSLNKEKLKGRAQRKGVSPGVLAREILIENLDDSSELEALKLKLRAVEEEVRHLRQDMSLAVQALLVASGKVSPEQAQEWANANLIRG